VLLPLLALALPSSIANATLQRKPRELDQELQRRPNLILNM
jgi:hypothetical protein